MHLSSIAATGIKGRSFKHALGPCTLICAPNYAGKSAIMDACRLAIGGYLPELGKQNAETMRLCGGDSMTVEAVTSGGGRIHRKWVRTGKGVEQTKSGTFEADCPLMNPEEYFSLSDDKRIDYIFSRVEMPEGFTVKTLIEALDKVLADSDDVTTDDEEAMEAIKGWVRKEIPDAPFAENLVTFLAPKSGKLASEFTHWNRKAKDTAGAVSTLAQMEPTAWQFDEKNLKAQKEEIAKAQDRLSAASERLGELRGKRAAAARNQKRREEIERLMAAPRCDHAAGINKQQERLSALEAEIPSVTPDVAAIAKLIGDLDMQIMVEQKQAESLEEKAAVLVAEIKEAATVEYCDKCSCSGKTFLKLREKLIANLEEQRETLERQREPKRKYLEELRERRNGKKTRLEIEQAEVARISKLEGDIQKAKDRLILLHRAKEDDETTIAALRKELAAMTDPEPVDGADVAAAEQEQETAEATLDALRDTERDAIAKRETWRTLEAAKREHEQATSFVRMISAARERIKRIQADMLERVFGGLCDTANRIGGGLLETPLKFNDGRLGRWTNWPDSKEQVFVPFDAFSGSEKRLASLSLAAALSAGASLRFLAVDEFGDLDAKNQAKAFRALRKAVEDGLLDQVVVAMPRVSPVAVEGWETIAL